MLYFISLSLCQQVYAMCTPMFPYQYIEKTWIYRGLCYEGDFLNFVAFKPVLNICFTEALLSTHKVFVEKYIRNHLS